jgi:outer membrane protein assembly factor BamA
LSLKDISAYERKLKSTRVYNYVRVRDSLMESGGSALLLNAEERVPGAIDVSAFWENLYGFGGSLGWSHGNLAGSLQEGRGGFTFAERKQSLFLGYASPLLFGTSIRFDNDFIVNWYQDGKFVKDSGWFRGDFDVSNQSKLSRQLLRWMRFVSGAELLGTSEKIDSATRLRDFNLNYLNSLFMHQLDDIVNPTRGLKLSLTWGNGGPLIRQGEVSVFRSRHNWFEVGSSAYLPLARWLVLALRLDGGRFYGSGGLNSERFFLGGGRSVRNEDWRHVCPDTASGICVKEGVEPAYFLGSVEARLQPFQPSWIGSEGKLRHLLGLQVVPFMDYGNVWEVGENLTESGKGHAVGVGGRYVFLALFNIRVDYAWDPRHPGNADRRRWIFDLIQAF